jgi:hypothetical protein
MAYKFQLGKAKLSGSVETTQGIIANGGLLVTGSVDLPAASIQTAELTDLNVTAAKLGAEAVETAKIKDLNVTAAKLGADAVETAKILNGAVTNDKLAGSIANAKLSNSTISGKQLGASLDTLSAATNGGLSTFSYDGSGAVTVALTSSIAGAGLAFAAGVLSVDTAEIAAGLSGSVEAMIGAFVEGSDFVTFDDGTGTIGVDAAKFSGSFSAALVTKSTTNLAEGTNLYYTDARVRGAVGAADGGGDGSFTYSSATGVFTYTGPSADEARKHFGGSDFVSYDSGSGVVGVLGANFTGSVRNAIGTPLLSGLSYNKAVGEFSLSSSIAGEALELVNGILNVRVDASSVEFYDDKLRVKSAGITNPMLAGSIANDKLLAIENAKLVNSSVTVTGGNGLSNGGSVALGSSVTLDVQVDTAALEINASDQVALRSTIGGSRTFSGDVTISGGLTVTGTTTYINTTNLDVADALVKIASGSAVIAANHGIELGGYASLKTALAVADVGDALSSSLPLVAPSMKAGTFYGNFVGASILGIATISAATADISANVTRANAASQVLTLPASPAVGQEHRIKCVVADASDLVIVIKPATGGKIEGVVNAQITLESFGAAVSLVYGGSAEGWMVF